MDPSPSEFNAGEVRSEQLLRDAHIARMRRQWVESENLCRRALDLNPEDVMGLEMLGDLLVEKGELSQALERYRAAKVLQPERPVLEDKIARLALRQAETLHEREMAELLLTSPANKVAVKRNATVAILLSLVCPGAGQVFNKQVIKGAIILAVWLPSLFGMMELFKFLLAILGAGRGLEPSGGLAALGLLGLLLWIYAMIDASSGAQRGKRSGLE